MLQSGNWSVPDFPWSEIHRKTPGHFWAIALSFRLFGTHEFALRIPSVLSVLLTIGGLFFLGKKIWGKETALAAALVLATSFLLPQLGKIAFTDAGLLMFETYALLALLLYLRQPSWKWNLLLWLSVAGGLLVKGPPIAILIGGTWLLLALFHPERKRLIGTHPWFWGPLAALPLAAWGWATYQKDGGLLLQFLWDWYVAKRVAGSVLGQTGWPGYHLLILLVSFIPWMTYLPGALARLVSGIGQKAREDLELGAWLVFGWLFYEAMASKLPTYSLAAQPALAVLLARQLLTVDRPGYRWAVWDRATAVLFLFVSLALSMALLVFAYQKLGMMEGMARTIPTAMLLWITSFMAVVGVYMNTPIRFQLAHGAMAIGGVGTSFLLWLSVMPLVEKSPLKGTKAVVLAARAATSPQTAGLVYLSDQRWKQPSLVFYLRQRFPNNEVFAPGQEDSLRAKFLGPDPAVLITDSLMADDLQQRLASEGRSLFRADTVVWWDSDHELKANRFFILKN
jgi:4-amino-4-deoxy-L-arabinose transferase-like glycosyltransferase